MEGAEIHGCGQGNGAVGLGGMRSTSKPVSAPKPAPASAEPRVGFVRGERGGLLRLPWKAGESGNPGGRGGLYQQCQHYCRTKSPESACKIYDLMHCGDERVEFMAASWIYERAWGKAREMDPKDLPRPHTVIDFSRLSAQQLEMLMEIVRSGAIRPAELQPDADDHARTMRDTTSR
jgi:hypothetical protein